MKLYPGPGKFSFVLPVEGKCQLCGKTFKTQSRQARYCPPTGGQLKSRCQIEGAKKYSREYQREKTRKP